MTSYSTQLVATASGGCLFARFRYDSRAPYAVTFEFVNKARWTFSRELLIEGITIPAGEGDVLIRPVKAGVEIELRSPNGRCVLVFDHNALLNALQKTLALVPLGSEVFDFDAEIAKLAHSRIDRPGKDHH
jgi:hypothetical protein